MATAGALAALVVGGLGYGTYLLATRSGVYDNVTIVHGVIFLVAEDATFSRPNPNECRGDGMYAAFGGGMEVVLVDAEGSVVAESRSTPQAGNTDSALDEDGANNCTAGFQFKDVSLDSESFTIAVGEPGEPVYATVTLTGEHLEDHREVGINIGADD